MRIIDNIPVFGTSVDEGALTQIKVCAQDPRASSCALMDDHRSYIGLSDKNFDHDVVKHSADEYARGDVNTNSIESVWAVMKRGMHGVYHKASKKHLNRYVDEFTFRLNAGKVQRHMMDRLNSLVDCVVGRRITYENLKGGKTWFDADSIAEEM